MPLTHDGMRIPTDPKRWDPDGKEWVSVDWSDAVDYYGAIQSSEWIIPDDWTSHQERTDVTVTDTDGVDHEHSNQAQLSTTASSGLAILTNRVTFADGTILDRSRYVVVDES